MCSRSTDAPETFQLEKQEPFTESICGWCAVALLTTRISQLAEHLKVHKKDHSSRHGLEAALNKRRKLLAYLRRTNFGAYANLISSLGLRDNYQKMVRFLLCFYCWLHDHYSGLLGHQNAFIGVMHGERRESRPRNRLPNLTCFPLLFKLQGEYAKFESDIFWVQDRLTLQIQQRRLRGPSKKKNKKKSRR